MKYRRQAPTPTRPRTSSRRLIHEVLFIGVPLVASSCSGSPSASRSTSSSRRRPRTRWTSTSRARSGCGSSRTRAARTALDALRVPAGRPVRLLITSRDVIHSFFVPAAPRQAGRAARPLHPDLVHRATGRAATRSSAPSTAGSGHSAMLGELVVMPAAEFDDWLAQQRRGLALAADGAPVPGERRATRGSSLVEEGRAPRGGARLPQVPHPRRHAATSARPGSTSTARPSGSQNGKTVVADEGYLTESMMDPGADDRRRVPERDAHVPGPARAARDRGHRRVHQVARAPQRSAPGRRRARPMSPSPARK